MSYSADQILQIAMFNERSEQSFYQDLSAVCTDKQMAALAVRFSAEEHKHFQIFEKMFNSLPADKKGAKMTANEMLDIIGTALPTLSWADEPSIWSDMDEALDTAIKIEADSIAFYQNSFSSLDDNAGILKTVIEEEKKHLAGLKEYSKTLNKK